jgi:hypothetical protein
MSFGFSTTNERFDFAKVFTKYADDDYKYPENNSKNRIGVHYNFMILTYLALGVKCLCSIIKNLKK